MSKRRERVAPPPSKEGWDLRYGTSDAVKGWEKVCAAAPANARIAWERLTADPRDRTDRQHPLKGVLGSARSMGARWSSGSTRSPEVGGSGTASTTASERSGSWTHHQAIRRQPSERWQSIPARLQAGPESFLQPWRRRRADALAPIAPIAALHRAIEEPPGGTALVARCAPRFTAG